MQEAVVGSAKATVESALANQRRLDQRKVLTRIIAPFSGRISARGYDIGALIIADKADTLRPLFRISQVDTLRVFIDAPQGAALAIKPGLAAQVHIRELPTRSFPGTVARASASLDQSTRTLLTQVDADVEMAQKVMRLLENLDDHDDVQNVYSNLNLTEEMVAQMEKG